METQTPAAAAATPSLFDQVKSEVVKSVVKGEFEVPVLPHVATEVMKMINNPNVNLQQMEAVVKQDQAIAAGMIKMANSALFRGVAEITSLQQAMARIGLKNVKDIVITLGVRAKTFQIAGFEDILGKIWEESIARALCGQIFAKQLVMDQEAAFLAGLLADIGKPIAVQVASKVEAKYRKAEEDKAKKFKTKFDPKTYRLQGLREEILPSVFDAYSSTIGAAVARRWNLSANLIDVVQFYREPAKSKEELRKFCWMVQLSQKVCEHFGFGQMHNKEINFAGEACVQALGLAVEEISDLLPDVQEKVQQQLSSFASN